ncbi:phosphoesterase [Halobacteriales archaeon QS_3_64_16]|nr:MAG: phosphoesterase [Halobacteriales archaeon QS_3_64_16]
MAPAPSLPPSSSSAPAAGSDPVAPIPDAPAALIETGSATGEGRNEHALVLADYHAGLEAGLRQEGVSVPSQAADRREQVHSLLDDTGVERVVFLGDLAHSIGDPRDEERAELEELFETVADRVSITVVKGNHDGGIESVVDRAGIDEISVTPTDGTRLGDIGFAHGHTWPASEVLDAPVVCVGHEHPAVRLTDSVGGQRIERAWLRGDLDRRPFHAHHYEPGNSEADDADTSKAEASDSDRTDSRPDGELVVFPAFNDLLGGTWINVPEQDFLAPFLPEGLTDGQAYLLDGTRLGDYRRV